MLHEVQTLRAMCTDAQLFAISRYKNSNIANQIHGFTIDYGKFILIIFYYSGTCGGIIIINA